MELEQDYFTLFSCEPNYKIDAEEISNRYIALQQKFHPDKFASASAQEQLLAAQVTAYINEAKRVLADSILRAEYLLKLGGNTQSLENNTMADGAFLMTQMELRERLESLSDEDETENFIAEIDVMQDNLAHDFAQHYQTDINQGFSILQKMKFFQRLAEQAEDKLDDY